MGLWLAWAVQTAAGYLIPLALSIVFSDWIGGPESIKVELLNDAFVAAMGLVLGLIVCLMVPSSRQSGRWVWTGPAGLLLFAVVSEMPLGDFNVLTVLFGTGEGGWVHFLITRQQRRAYAIRW
jgi:hypothetical protein